MDNPILMDTSLPVNTIDQLIQIETEVHYTELPPPGRAPFVIVKRESSIILSAPHGAITFRNNDDEIWHEEDEYTAGMALLLSEICGTSVIATIWRTADSDPNEHGEERSGYKQELRRLTENTNARWLIDLHGASEDSANLASEQKIDLGIGKDNEYLPKKAHASLVSILDKHLGEGATDKNGKKGFSAKDKNRIAAFAYQPLGLGLNSVQIEMKPSVRVPLRRVDSSMYQKNSSKYGGPYSAPSQNMLGMMKSLVEFIEYLKTYKEST
jgi:hypothetical protein